MVEQSVFSKGLEDIVAAESSICSIDGKNSKLLYRGYEIHDLVENSNFEETTYLLLFGELPKADELADFKRKVAAERELPRGVLDLIRLAPKEANPMTVLRTAVSCLALFDPEADDKSPEANVRKAFRLIAKVPLIVAAFERVRKGWEILPAKQEASVSTAENFLYLLKGKEAAPLESRMLDRYFILLTEHDLNASTFAARTAASTLSDIYSAMTAAIGTLKGDLHGSANTRTMESLLAIGDARNVEKFVEEAIGQKKKFMGFGHRVYKGPDPRAHDLKRMSKALADAFPAQAKWYAISEKLEQAVWEKKKLNCNVDFYSASVLYTVGIPTDLFTPMFAVSRTAGWAAHILEQYKDNRLIRPVSQYTGAPQRPYLPIGKR
ncbi:MAG: citrate synthase [Candidatus Omnitrophica bacterium]|nr:citrate synthase [Candidatus Omnitrophota bacterium]